MNDMAKKYEQQAEHSTKYSLSELKGIIALENDNGMSYDEMHMACMKEKVDVLMKRIEKGIEDYHNGVYFTQEEVDALMDHWTEGL